MIFTNFTSIQIHHFQNHYLIIKFFAFVIINWVYSFIFKVFNYFNLNLHFLLFFTNFIFTTIIIINFTILLFIIFIIFVNLNYLWYYALILMMVLNFHEIYLKVFLY